MKITITRYNIAFFVFLLFQNIALSQEKKSATEKQIDHNWALCRKEKAL